MECKGKESEKERDLGFMLHGGQYEKLGVLSLASSRLSGMRLRLMGFYAERGLDSFKVAKAETVSRSYEKANSHQYHRIL